MLRLPPAVEPLLGSFRPAFFAPTYQRFVLLALGAIVGMGRRSVSRILGLLGDQAPGHPSSYHRVLSAARWKPGLLARVLAQAIVACLDPELPIYLCVDDTVCQHKGRKVYGKGAHRDPVRSSWNYHALRYGHRWVVLAILLPLPFTPRPWALPVLSALYQTQRACRQQRLPHKTPCRLAEGLVLHLLRWFPQRRFLLLGDWGFGHHQFATGLQCLSRGRCQLVARIRADARLYAAPPQAKARRGRPRIRGARLPSPQNALRAGARMHSFTVRWYGAQQRQLSYLSGCGLWYWARGKGRGIVLPIRWVYVHDPENDRYDCFFSTDLSLSPRQIVQTFAWRWSLEVTFQECRAHLGLETPRQRARSSVLRTTPCLFGLFSLITLAYRRLLQAGHAPKPRGTPCYRKSHVTFSDALLAVRREIWECFLSPRLQTPMRNNSGPPLTDLLIEFLSAAA